jgi:hypothetical protein
MNDLHYLVDVFPYDDRFGVECRKCGAELGSWIHTISITGISIALAAHECEE